jgi:hypothetical protein
MNKTTKQYAPQVSTAYLVETREPEQKNVEIDNVEIDKIGFSDKTMWDWLILFSTLAIPIIVLCATVAFSIQQEMANEAQHTNELRIAEANRQNDLKMATAQEEETTLAAYLDGITNLLLQDKLGSPQASYDARIVARAKTMIALHRLSDPHRKSMVVQFLYEAHLITGKQPLVSLAGADLSGVDLQNVELSGVNLSDAHLHMALLRNADLSDANLSGADMSGTKMKGANLRGADLSGANTTNG